MDSAGLVCYFPVLSKKDFSKKAAHLIRQGVVNAVLDCIEAVARHGFVCRLPTPEGNQRIYHCRPFVCSIQADSKETKEYCCLRAERCCPWCRHRKGFSNFKKCKPHNVEELEELWKIADIAPLRSRDGKLAREKLQRWGFHATQRCGLLVHARACLLPGPPDSGPYRGVVGVDIMHGIFIAWHRYIMDGLDLLLRSEKSKARFALNTMVSNYVLTHPDTGKRTRRINSLFGKEGLTAEKRVLIVFLLACALAPDASILRDEVPQDVKEALLQAVASAELVFLACRNHRAYTNKELVTIFEDQGLLFFASLEKIYAHAQQQVHSFGCCCQTCMC